MRILLVGYSRVLLRYCETFVILLFEACRPRLFIASFFLKIVIVGGHKRNFWSVT